MKQYKTELLAPAGDWERLEMAVAYGADAVYLAGTTFGMRAFAGNFTGEDLKRAVAYCKAHIPARSGGFAVLDCVRGEHPDKYGFIYAVAVIHMLVLDEDRNAFYAFVRDHLAENGLALICTMGDGEAELKSDISTAFQLQERDHESGKMLVAGTSCRMVSFETFERELTSNGLKIVEKGITESLPDFNSLMYAIVSA